VLGAAALVLLQELFQSQEIFGDYARHWHLSLGLAIIALVAWLPDGLIGLVQRRTPPAAPPPAAAARTSADDKAQPLSVSGDSHA